MEYTRTFILNAVINFTMKTYHSQNVPEPLSALLSRYSCIFLGRSCEIQMKSIRTAHPMNSFLFISDHTCQQAMCLFICFIRVTAVYLSFEDTEVRFPAFIQTCIMQSVRRTFEINFSNFRLEHEIPDHSSNCCKFIACSLLYRKMYPRWHTQKCIPLRV